MIFFGLLGLPAHVSEVEALHEVHLHGIFMLLHGDTKGIAPVGGVHRRAALCPGFGILRVLHGGEEDLRAGEIEHI